MIVTILELRAHVLRFLQKFQLVVEPIVKFIIAFAVFRSINNAIGCHEMLMSLPAELLLSLLGTFTPSVLLVLLAAAVALVHVYVASPLLAILVAVLMAILYCFIARFSGKYGYVVLAVPILFLLKIPYVVPLVLGLIATPTAAIPAACGVIVYRMFEVISNVALVEDSMGIEDILTMYIDVIDRLVADKQMLLTAGVFFVIILAMYLVRKLSIEYAFEISIAVGAIVCILGFLVADSILHTEMNIVGMVFGTVGSMLIALVFNFFRLALDYTAVERVQFEDDDYYYYVKAVPKINLAVPERSVKQISTQNEPVLSEDEQGEEEMLSDEERYAMGEELDEEPAEDSTDLL